MLLNNACIASPRNVLMIKNILGIKCPTGDDLNAFAPRVDKV
jgi:hypothetical protein